MLAKKRKYREYTTWNQMHQRCYNPKAPYFFHYGGRGIYVCARWHRDNPNGFDNFVTDMGLRPVGKCIDRINGKLGYEPANCRWLTIKEQQANRIDNRPITAFGETKLITFWESDPRCRVIVTTIGKRLDAGWTPEDAISKPSNFIAEPSTCPKCGISFVKRRTWGKFCSRNCKNLWKVKNRRKLQAMGI